LKSLLLTIPGVTILSKSCLAKNRSFFRFKPGDLVIGRYPEAQLPFLARIERVVDKDYYYVANVGYRSVRELQKVKFDGGPEDFRNITWDYATTNIYPVAYIDEKPIKLFNWEIVSGEYVTADFVVYLVTYKKCILPAVQIDPEHVLRCNVGEKWIEYVSFGEGSKRKRLNNVQNLAVNLYDPNGNTVVTLR